MLAQGTQLHVVSEVLVGSQDGSQTASGDAPERPVTS
jgi:hypothetical protein